MSDFLSGFLRSSRGVRGIYSVCSAHPFVIEAAMHQALADGTHLLLEATSNQVNQMGGYTGMTPPLFHSYVLEIAKNTGFDPQRLILGGDHLGPNPWRHLDAHTAMAHAVEMVRMYVGAGFSKIHLDASMRCSDDSPVLADELMAERAATLCRAAEEVREALGLPAIVYVIGTEVPVPGGASHALDGLVVTSCEAVERTLAIHHAAFVKIGLKAAWQRVVAIVVQPGVEFDHASVVDYDPAQAKHLQSFLQSHPELVMEAHSSDYQKPEAYAELIRDGFAILKVGPALTFAMREALYSLAAMERELVKPEEESHLVEIMEQVMLTHPANWEKYYRGDEQVQKRLRIYSYSDRIRYYWGFPDVTHSVTKLLSKLQQTGMDETLLSAFCPLQYAALRQGRITADPKQVVIEAIRGVLRIYSNACLGKASSQE